MDHPTGSALDIAQHGHELIITLSPSHFKRQDIQRLVRGLQFDIHLLVMQRLRVSKIRHFLNAVSRRDDLKAAYAAPLLKQLDNTGLYDLAAVPWFFVDMVERAKAGQLPRSRVVLLHDQVQDAIARMGHSQGIQYYALEALCALCLEMSAELRETLTVPEVFDILNTVRRNRDFSLELFTTNLWRHGC
ncbi:MAG: hypothetical protein R2932_07020 [Caldilineaceae bacterium]